MVPPKFSKHIDCDGYDASALLHHTVLTGTHGAGVACRTLIRITGENPSGSTRALALSSGSSETMFDRITAPAFTNPDRFLR